MSAVWQRLAFRLAATLAGIAAYVSTFAQTNSTNAAVLPARSFLGMGGVRTTQARQASPRFTGMELPLPPQQESTWFPPASSLPTNCVSATALLFEQGMADPRGCEYRELEVGTGDIWHGDGGVVKTHGWVLPGNDEPRFTVCWNGLVYPVVSVGEAADLRADVLAAVQQTERMWRSALPEGFTVAHQTCLPLKGCLLLRLGEPELARQMWAAVRSGNQKGFDAPPGATMAELGQVKLDETDPYLGWASDWAWALFERAVCAHMRGDDGLALASARLLSTARSSIETEAERRGFKRQQTPNSPWDGKYQDYLNFLSQLPLLLADQERRAKRHEPAVPLEEIAKLTNRTDRVSALIDQLDQVGVRQWGQPGGLGPWETDPVVAALLKQGQPAVEPLLEYLETNRIVRLNRSVSFGRDFHRGRWLHFASEPIAPALHSLLGVSNFGSWATTNEPAKAGTNSDHATAIQIRAWMQKFAGKTPPERWYLTLLDDSAGVGLWIDAAGNITKPIHTSPAGKTNAVAMQGESLRTKTNPTVTEIMARRVRESAVTNFPSTSEFYGFDGAYGFALTLARWDATGAVPTLRWQMNVARDLSESTNWFMVAYGQDRFIGAIVALTLARMEAGDANALMEYATWLRSRQPGQAFIDSRSGHGSSFNRPETLKPASQFADVPTVREALDNLLSNPDSPWRPSLVGSNGTIGLAGNLVLSPLLGCELVRRYLLAGLNETAHAGNIEFGPSLFSTNDLSVHYKYDVGWNCNQNVKRADKLPDDTTAALPFRVCDLFAEQVASVETAPPFALYWSLTARDDAIKALIEFVEEKGGKLTELVEQKRKREWWRK